jgi:hypothetical protein
MKHLYIAITLTLSFVTTLHADTDTIYKIIDDQGNVTYTATPPAGKDEATTINVAPEPSEERIDAAQERHEKNVKAGEIIVENRAEQTKIAQEKERIRKEKQLQQQQDQQSEINNNPQHYGYPYYPRRFPGKPIARPPVHRPARPMR